jgi:hypothetical protein
MAVTIVALEAPTPGSPPLRHFANFERNARPSVNIEDYRVPCRGDECYTTEEAREFIAGALARTAEVWGDADAEAMAAIVQAIYAAAEIWPDDCWHVREGEQRLREMCVVE